MTADVDDARTFGSFVSIERVLLWECSVHAMNIDTRFEFPAKASKHNNVFEAIVKLAEL
jgi:hypothetical protein